MNLTLPAPPPHQPGDGVFPFGQPNTPRPARWDGQGTPRQLVLGVYPSALHVRWHPPAHLHASPTRIAAMAVDVEPEVFWDGGDATARIAVWKDRVGFLDGDTPGCHGHASPTTNGPSGATLDGYFTGPIHDRGDTVFADVYPVYMVKRSGPGTKRKQQGDALDEKFNPLADRLPATAAGRAGPSTLPTRIPPKALPAHAVARFGDWLQELLNPEPRHGGHPRAGTLEHPGPATRRGTAPPQPGPGRDPHSGLRATRHPAPRRARHHLDPLGPPWAPAEPRRQSREPLVAARPHRLGGTLVSPPQVLRPRGGRPQRVRRFWNRCLSGT